MDVIKTADHVIDLGPEGVAQVAGYGHAGGCRQVQGLAYGRFLKSHLRA